jgi:hypothetical protein
LGRRRPVADAEADGAEQVGQLHVGRADEHIAGVREEHRADRTQHRRAQLRVQHDLRVAAERKARRRNRRRHADGIEREAADRRVASGEESLARGQIADDLLNGIAFLVDAVDDALEGVGEAEPGAGGDTNCGRPRFR